jgi:hypothetical protein
MNENEYPFRSLANPRRTTLISLSASEAAAPRREEHHLQAGDDSAAVSVDGSAAITD